MHFGSYVTGDHEYRRCEQSEKHHAQRGETIQHIADCAALAIQHVARASLRRGDLHLLAWRERGEGMEEKRVALRRELVHCVGVVG